MKSIETMLKDELSVIESKDFQEQFKKTYDSMNKIFKDKEEIVSYIEMPMTNPNPHEVINLFIPILQRCAIDRELYLYKVKFWDKCNLKFTLSNEKDTNSIEGNFRIQKEFIDNSYHWIGYESLLESTQKYGRGQLRKWKDLDGMVINIINK